MKEHIKKLRKELDLTQQKFADKIGVKRNTIAMYEMGKTIPSDQTVKSICREFNVNEEWLRNGIGEMFKETPSDALDQLAYKYHLSEADYIMVEKFVTMRPEARQLLFHYMKEINAIFENTSIDLSAPAYKPLPIGKILDTKQETETKHKPTINEHPKHHRRQLEG
ncbi:MAG: helix-turn-helix transcriptional regulator [Eubacterium sp.]|nr:helix-turn-helix transcriptional regulator [Eubacterium sp.]